MPYKLVTFCVLNEDKSSVFKEKHPPPIKLPNIFDISVTFWVLNEDKLSAVKDEHLVNIACMLVTFFVLKDLKSNDFNPEQQ